MKIKAKYFPYWLRQVSFLFILLPLTGGLLGLAAFLPTTVVADINPQINYQGRLTDNLGVAIADGFYHMEFKLYTEAVGGTLVWTETWTGGNRVQVVDGHFSLMLGSLNSLDNVNFNQILYLAVNVGGSDAVAAWDGEMAPRKILGAVPASMEARKLGGLEPAAFLRSDLANNRATITNATTTNLYSSLINSVTGFFNNLTADNFQISDLSAINATTTNATTTNLYSSLINSVAGFFNNLTADNLTTRSLFINGSSIYFQNLQGGPQSLAWSTTTNRFEASTALFVPRLYATSSLIDTLTLGGGLTNSLLATNHQGQVVATSSDTFVSNYLLASTTLPSLFNYFTRNGDGSLFYNDGNVGIGTTSPYAKLSVDGDIVAASLTTNTTATSTFGGGIDIASGCFAINGVCLSTGGGSGDSAWTASGDDIYFANNVAIGSSDFGGRLSVAQSANTSSGGISLKSAGIATSGWTEQTGAGSTTWRGITSSSDGTKLAAVVVGGYIYTSSDSGVTWTQQTGSGSKSWWSITSSSDGTKLAATVYGGYIYTSSDSGVTWTEQTGSGSRSWGAITSSSDGTKLAAAVSGGYIYTSADSGVTWTRQTGSGLRVWTAITSSSDGTKLAAVVDGGYIYTSSDSGVTWTQQTGSGSKRWWSITSSSDGTKLAAAVSGGYIYTSADSGVTWTQQTGSGLRTWRSIDSSSDGTKLIAGAGTGYIEDYIYTSEDSGVTWTEQTEAGSKLWESVTSSSDGTKLAAVDYGVSGGYIYTYGSVGDTYASRSLFIDEADNFRLSGTSLDYLTITNTGNVGLGTNSPAAKLNLAPFNNVGEMTYSNLSTKEGLAINSYINTADHDQGVVDFVALRHSSASSGGSKFRFFTQATSTAKPSLAMTIDKDGRVGILSAPDANTMYGLTLPSNINTGYGRAYAWDTYSDARIKTNQQPLKYGLAELLELKPKSFNQHSSHFEDGQLILSDDSQETIGLIAQEVYGVIPEAVNKAEDETQGLWGINYDKLTPVIIKAIQELAAKVTALETQFNNAFTGTPPIVDSDGNDILYTYVYNVRVSNVLEIQGQTTFSGSALFVSDVNFLSDVFFEKRVDFRGGVKIQKGITIIDSLTGEEYCILVADGEDKIVKGSCDMVELIESSVESVESEAGVVATSTATSTSQTMPGEEQEILPSSEQGEQASEQATEDQTTEPIEFVSETAESPQATSMTAEEEAEEQILASEPEAEEEATPPEPEATSEAGSETGSP